MSGESTTATTESTGDAAEMAPPAENRTTDDV